MVRRAARGDAPAILALMAELGRPAVEEQPQAQLRVLDRYLDDPNRAVLVAVVDGAVAGACTLWIRDRLNWTTPEAWIPDLVVSSAYRRRGVARVLSAAATALARERGCHLLRLEAGWRRTEGHRLYASYGFRRAGIDFQLVLDSETPRAASRRPQSGASVESVEPAG